MPHTFSITVTDEQIDCLSHNIPKTDIITDLQRRIDNAVISKVEACATRIIQEGMIGVNEDDTITSIPKDKGQLISLIRNHSSYKDRDARDAEEAAKGS